MHLVYILMPSALLMLKGNSSANNALAGGVVQVFSHD